MIDPARVHWSAVPELRRGRPLLVVLHGHGLHESVGADLWSTMPAELIIAGLRGPLPVGAGYGWFRLDATASPAVVNAVAEDVLDWLTEQLEAISPSSVGILGFSQGSSVALQCLRLRPEQFSYAVSLSGFVVPVPHPGDATLAKLRPPVFAARGGRDQLVPAFLATLTDRWLADHTDLRSHRYPELGHSVSQRELQDLSAFLAEQLLDPQ